MRWNFFLFGLLVLTIAAIGAGMDALATMTVVPLFTALMLSSLMGVTLGAIYAWPRANRVWKRIALLIGLYAAWRLLYYPWLLAATVLAAGVEGAVSQLVFVRPWVYPTMLLAITLAHLGSASLVGGLLLRRGAWLTPAVLLLLSWGTAVSLVGPRDWDWLPTGVCGCRIRAFPGLPMVDPYALANKSPRRAAGFQRRAASLAYRLLARGSWGQVLGGAWETAVAPGRGPSTADRVDELILAMRAAHPFVGQREILVRWLGPAGNRSLAARVWSKSPS